MDSDWKQKVTNNFDRRAASYEANSAIQKQIAESLSQDLPAINAPDVLEIGCGTGLMTEHLLKQYPDGKFWITDISPKMISTAQQHLGQNDNINWTVMDGECPTIGRSFDLIVSSMALQWFTDIESGLDRLRAMLKPNGVLLFSMPASYSFREWKEVLNDMSLQQGTLKAKNPSGIYREEEIVIDYPNTLAFLQNMKRIGANTPQKDYRPLSRHDLLKACAKTDEKFQGRITWNIIYGRLEAH